MKQTLIMLFTLSTFSLVMGQETLYLPHFTTKGGNWSTELAIANSDGTPHSLTITAYNDEGASAGTWNHTLPAYGGLNGSIGSLCSGLTAETGSLILETDNSTASGLLKFTYNSTGGTSSLPLSSETGRYLSLPLLENKTALQSGFAIVNTSDEANQVRLILRSFEGVTIQTIYRELPAHGKWVAMLADSFEGPIPESTFLEIDGEHNLTGFALSFTPQNQQIIAVPGRFISAPELSEEDILLNNTFRIDIQTIEASLDFYPLNGNMEGEAHLSFYMLPGQNMPLVHLSSHILNRIKSITLDGESLSSGNNADVKIITFQGSSQQALEFQRNLDEFSAHELVITYEKTFQAGLNAFYADVNDIQGNGNEVFFPTINRPAELARHLLTFRVHDNQSYYLIGSGNVQEQEAGQTWLLDTERQIASYTVFFFLGAQDAFTYQERVIHQIPVRVMTTKAQAGGALDAFNILTTWLPQITSDIGTFPMPRGLSLFITSSGGGMEYFGGSFTSNWALQHEVFHMYFACSSVAKTYRDSWWDEAITMWYEEGPGAFQPINESYHSNLVSGRSPITPGFDTRAYDEGARMFQHISEQLGGRTEFIAYLSHLNNAYRWSPLLTQDILLNLKRYSGLDYFDFFQQWLYSDSKTKSPAPSENPWHHVVIPPELLRPRPGFTGK